MNIARQMWNQLWAWLTGTVVENQADAQAEAYAEARFDEFVMWMLGNPETDPSYVCRQSGSVSVEFQGLVFWFWRIDDESDVAPLGARTSCELVRSKGPAARNARLLALQRWPFAPEEPFVVLSPAERVARIEQRRTIATAPPVQPQALIHPLEASDSETGVDARPARYTSPSGRETIDEMRDQAGVFFAQALDAGCSVDDAVFAAHCELTALKYLARHGKKGTEADAAKDQIKANFYLDYAAHVRGEGPDPRSNRPGFVPYRRAK